MFISFLTPALVMAVGTFLLFKLKFFFILHPIKTAKNFISAVKDRDARRSLILALAGTLGVGNMFGVAAGIMIGGVGSVFWLFISSIFAMIIKYSETLLVFDSTAESGGMAVAIKSVFRRAGGVLSTIYALLTVALSLFMGSAMQSSALVDVAGETLSLSPNLTALLLIILILPAAVSNGKQIENITEIIIPLTTLIYIFMSFLVIFLNFSKIPSAISLIFNSAFSERSVVGGAISIPFLAVKEGFARGILSNEAGTGTSALGHSHSRGREPQIAGLFGMCEVFFDTTLLCALTALVILLSAENIGDYATPMALVTAAFRNTLGNFSGYALLGLIFAFAYSTIICWYSYGNECISLYFPGAKPIFTPCFFLFVLISGYISSAFLLSLTDVILLCMSLITLSAILKRTKRITELSRTK